MRLAAFEWIARDYPQVACAMLCRLMPQQQQTEVKVEHRYETFEEIAARLRELGLEHGRYPKLFIWRSRAAKPSCQAELLSRLPSPIATVEQTFRPVRMPADVRY
jgi:hypothetical protein